METLEAFELTSPYPLQENPGRSRKRNLPQDIPILEWRKRLSLAPKDVITKTLDATTQSHLTIPGDGREEPHCHFVSRAPGL